VAAPGLVGTAGFAVDKTLFNWGDGAFGARGEDLDAAASVCSGPGSAWLLMALTVAGIATFTLVFQGRSRYLLVHVPVIIALACSVVPRPGTWRPPTRVPWRARETRLQRRRLSATLSGGLTAGADPGIDRGGAHGHLADGLQHQGSPMNSACLALLGQRHHSVVHDRDLRATIDPEGVTWHR